MATANRVQAAANCQFVNPMRHGHGRVRRPHGWRFEGQFEAGSQRGEGTLTLGSPPEPQSAAAMATGEGEGGGGAAEAAAAEGSFVSLHSSSDAFGEGETDEFGVAAATDGVHGSSFVNFELLGEGLRTYASGDAYEGELRHDTPHGEGTLHFVRARRRAAHQPTAC